MEKGYTSRARGKVDCAFVRPFFVNLQSAKPDKKETIWHNLAQFGGKWRKMAKNGKKWQIFSPLTSKKVTKGTLKRGNPMRKLAEISGVFAVSKKVVTLPIQKPVLNSVF